MRSHSIASFFLLALGLLHSQAVLADYKKAAEAFRAKDWAQVFRDCKDAADAGEMHCQANLGYLYKNGFGVVRDLPRSIEYLKKCAAQGQLNCEEMLGDSYRSGQGVEVNYAEALRLFLSSSSKGNLWAYNNLGNLYLNGQGVKRDPAEAARNYRIAAEKGNPAGQANLADLYRVGLGVEKNGTLAFDFATKSAQRNYGNGWNILGLLHRDGLGTKKDMQSAISAFKKAVDPSVTYPAHIAYANLARIYYRGDGVPVDLDESARWATAGVKVNQRDSMNWLANILARGTAKIPKDPDQAFQLARKSSALGLVAAKNTLGVFYRDGVGTPRDLQLAFQMFNEAAEAGQLDARVNLGRMYLEGSVVTKDVIKAEGYFLSANANRDSLGVAASRYLDNYFAKNSSASNQIAKAPIPSADGVSPASKAMSSTNTTQQELLSRLEAMQRQLEQLQSANNLIVPDQLSATASATAIRRALIIGNDRYRHVPELRNAREDATSISASLRNLGYSTTLHRDLDEKDFKKALRDFRASLEGGEEVLFFFAGHGVQLGSANYLLPIDVKGDNEEQVKDEAIELQRVLDDLKSKNSKFALAIIDACRDNPFKTSGRAIGGRGLAPTTAATGQMVMFSAGAGQQALDSLGATDKERNGVFTRVLLKEMTKQGVPVDRVLRNVRNEVVRLSKSVGHEQTPALYDQAVGDFYFKK